MSNPTAPSSRCARRPRWIAHAGLAITRPGGAPDRESLARAVQLGVDWLELDVCATADGALVLHHDAWIATRERIADLTLDELRHRSPGTLTLDDGREVVGERVRLLLDVKTDVTASPLAAWLGRRPRSDTLAVCTERVPTLVELRRRAPRVARWLSLPDLGEGWIQAGRRIAAALWDHRRLAAIPGVTRDPITLPLGTASGRRDLLASLGGLPFRSTLPPRLEQLTAPVAAAAVTVQHWIVTPQLCEAAHVLRLPVVAWTVNDGTSARRVVNCGVDCITTDRVAMMREAVARLDGAHLDRAPSAQGYHG